MPRAEIHPYSRLSPDRIIAAVETLGLACDGRVLALNSYENRVYQVGVEDAEPVVVKFYRPGRWSRRALLEEHSFAAELAAVEVPVVAPLLIRGATLHAHEGFQYAAYARKGGRWPELGTRDERVMMGRFIGRMHAVGSVRPFAHRLSLDPRRMGRDSALFLLEGGWLPEHLLEA